MTTDIYRTWPAVLRPQQCAAYIGLSRTGLYQTFNTDPSFPRQVRLSARCVGWRREAIDAWLREKEGAS